MPIAALLRSAQKAEEPGRELTPLVRGFLATLLQHRTPGPLGDVPVIHVSSVVSEAAVFYERLRYSLDYREEHLLRRHALERLLRRRFEEQREVAAAARPLLVEFVQAQYLKNDSIPEVTVGTVQMILDKYEAVFQAMEPIPLKDKAAIRRWLLGLASAELDSELVPAPEEQALVDLMGSYVARDNPLEDWNLSEEERTMQVFIACYRALFAFDLQTLHWLLLLRRLPEWQRASPGAVTTFLPALVEVRVQTERALRHPVGAKLYRALKQRAIAFHVLKDVTLQYQGEARALFVDAGRLAAEAGEVCQRYYKAARRRLYRSAVRATLYILLTKVILALALEAPVEQYLYGAVATTPLLINLAFPPALMLLLTATTRLPGQANTAKVLQVLHVILYGENRRVFVKLRPPEQSASVSRSLFSLSYLLAFIVTFGLIVRVLGWFNFTVFGIGLFLLFLCIVSFFALRIRQPIRDLFVTKQRENLLVVLIEFFSLPILRMGQWISVTSARFNVFLYLFDYFLEAPFKAFLLRLEDVLGFFREKREDLL